MPDLKFLLHYSKLLELEGIERAHRSEKEGPTLFHRASGSASIRMPTRRNTNIYRPDPGRTGDNPIRKQDSLHERKANFDI